MQTMALLYKENDMLNPKLVSGTNFLNVQN